MVDGPWPEMGESGSGLCQSSQTGCDRNLDVTNPGPGLKKDTRQAREGKAGETVGNSGGERRLQGGFRAWMCTDWHQFLTERMGRVSRILHAGDC